ncbi:MAG: hypothetical protein PQJ60_13955 [Spirochaetales bacterium]|nr:hypothetical protein [Spirochaetales bacterium]
MKDTLTIIIYSSAAGLPIFLGALISLLFNHRKSLLKDTVNHGIVAFGGGALLSAIAFVLIPTAVGDFSISVMSLIFIGGTFSFMGLDLLCSRIGGSLAQVLSMMMDFIPEALALGASFSYNHNLGLLIAIFIGLQNLPEGYNSFIELNDRMKRGKALMILFCLSFVGIFSALTGEFFLENSPKLVDGIMLFSGGGILYLIFQDIAPLSKEEGQWLPATGASLGFLLGMIGEKILN